MNNKNKILFISDLHLDKQREDISHHFSLFVQYCLKEKNSIKALYILGDLFDFWFGDDASIPLYQDIVQQLQHITSAQISLYIMHGNRDFLLGSAFAQATGCQLIDDPYRITLADKEILLAHGDQLCTDDIEYQQFKKWVRNPQTIKDYLQKPIQERMAIANSIRNESKKSGQAKTMEIMDVNQQAVESFMHEHHVRTLIHGHTHRPDMHFFTFNGESMTRYVLSDWDHQCSYLEWTGQQLQSHSL